ncbi:unnamed protein product [Pocillopora meandrina]|uniref:Uncharacterized protein n=1 Tax=Pocillopora meandrina TaxID=46732 RepID=A0AAU9VQP0_9CNID|nr:unnamed protein product [Pocillopora meandrina]
MPLYLHKSLFGDKSLTPTSVQIFGYGESPVANLGACTIAIHTGDRQQPQMATSQVTDTRGKVNKLTCEVLDDAVILNGDTVCP